MCVIPVLWQIQVVLCTPGKQNCWQSSEALRKAVEEGEVVVGMEYVMRQEAVQVFSILLNS